MMTDYAGVKAWRKANPEKVAKQAKRRNSKPSVKPLLAANSKRWREAHIDERRPIEADKARARRNGDPEGQKQRMAKFKAKREAERVALAGRPRPDVCEICGEFNRQIVFDHCHAGGYFRGWLCDRCNKTLGIVKDSPKLLRALASYLENGNGAINSVCSEKDTNEPIRITWAKEVSP